MKKVIMFLLSFTCLLESNWCCKIMCWRVQVYFPRAFPIYGLNQFMSRDPGSIPPSFPSPSFLPPTLVPVPFLPSPSLFSVSLLSHGYLHHPSFPSFFPSFPLFSSFLPHLCLYSLLLSHSSVFAFSQHMTRPDPTEASAPSLVTTRAECMSVVHQEVLVPKGGILASPGDRLCLSS